MLLSIYVFQVPLTNPYFCRMKTIFKPGDKKEYSKTVMQEDAAVFEAGEVHPLYSTFALGRDAEWVCRLFVLEMKDETEEGIGTMLHIEHLAPALVNSNVKITATVKSIVRNEIICKFEVNCGKRLIAKGEQGQKILLKSKVEKMINNLLN